MYKTIKLSFCTLDIRNRIVIATINEGIHLNYELSEEIILAVFNLIGDKPTVYITNRINSYSVDPTLYTEVSKVNNIIGFGIITTTEVISDVVQVEKLFYKNNFRLFNNTEDAISWASNLLKPVYG